MRFPAFIGPSYTLQSVNVDCQRCINWFPEINELGTGKEREVAALIPSPGLRLLVNVGEGPIRGELTANNGQLFVVRGNKLYRISNTWVATELGTLSTNTGPVSMADSGRRLAVVDGSVNGYFWKYETSIFSAIPFPEEINFSAFAGCAQVAFQDGYFIFIHKNTTDFFISGKVDSIVADDSTIDILDFSNADGNPDLIVAVISDHRDLWIFGSESTEVWFNSGDADFPFARNQGGFVEHGCAAAFSVAKMNNTVFWLGKDDKGNGMVFQAKGYQPVRISNHAVELALQSYGDLSGARAYTYQEGGHHFYALSCPGGNTTWVFDTATNLWHERAYLNQGLLERHRADSHAFAFGVHVVGDYQNGNLYELSSKTYSDNGQAIMRRRRAPHFSEGGNFIHHHEFRLDVQGGTGLDGVGQGTDPKIMLRWSDDGGNRWSNEKWTQLGKIGQTLMRPIWRKLGRSRDRVYEITITDPVKAILIGADVRASMAGK